jgi:hypothetical protein
MVAADRLRQAVIWQGRYHRPVRRLIKLGLVILATRVFMHWWRSRGAHQEPMAVAPANDPADELRRKIAESREDEKDVAGDEPPTASVAERRTEVHEQGRAAVDEMKSSDEG